MNTGWTFRVFAAVLTIFCMGKTANGAFQIGAGIADCTGPAAGVNFMGYAQLAQIGSGLHLRQFARAFVISDGTRRFVFVSVDTGMIGYGMREAVIKNLEESYGNTYNIQNVIISGTHTHGTPGGFLQHFMFDVTVLGFVKQTFDAYVEGITKAVVSAHENMVAGRIFLNYGELLESNINRSPTSYLANPPEERAQYTYNVDKDMYQLRFVNSATSEPIGIISWFPIHPVSMNNSNHLITSDNVGYASVLLEKSLNENTFPGKGRVVTAFASTNLGDVSPNTKGPMCVNTGLPCDEETSTCEGESAFCIASGPGSDMFESTKIIAENMFQKALELMTDNTNMREVTGDVRVIHQFVHMPSQTAQYQLGNGTTISGSGCKSAMGYSFAAGTTDGPGEFDFTQGTTEGNSFWDIMRNLLARPTEEDIECHRPKPILLATGQMTKPYEWQPQIASTQLAMIGNVAIVGVPGEFTTMAGRRLRNAVRDVMMVNGAGISSTVIVAGLCNHYTDYITTYEEYQRQRYEAASTIYGPHTHGIYLAQYRKLATALMTGVGLDDGPDPPTFDQSQLLSFVAPVLLDTPDLDNDFGTVKTQPALTVNRGATARTVIVAGHPRNNLMHGGTFLTVERLNGATWEVVANDAFWETRFTWTRTYLASSEVTIEWDVPQDAVPGTYRIRHFGYAKSLFAEPSPYVGVTNNFTVA